jgi:hypothetical protein
MAALAAGDYTVQTQYDFSANDVHRACRVPHRIECDETAYFIPEDSSTELPMYEVTWSEVEWPARIARRLSTITLKNLQWMIVESDHDQFIVTKRDNDDVRDLDTP